MTSLPLYPAPSQVGVGITPPIAINPKCNSCPLHKSAKKVCFVDSALDLHTGGLLVIGDYPTEIEERVGEVWGSPSGQEFKNWLSDYEGPVTFAYALKCKPPLEEDYYAEADLCRPYLAEEIQRLKPERVIVLGPLALYAVTGEKAPAESDMPSCYSLRRGLCYLPDQTPVFITIHPKKAFGNRFIKAALQEDIEWACRTTPMFGPAWALTYELITTVAQAEAAVEIFKRASFIGFDVKAAGQLFDRYEVLSVSISPALLPNHEKAYVWPRAMLKTEVFAPLKKALEEVDIRKVGQNAKLDMAALRWGLGVELKGLWGDTLLWRKLLDTYALGGVSELAWLVGMGGGRQEFEGAVEKLKRQVRADIRGDGKEAKKVKAAPSVLARCVLGTAEGLARGDRPEKYIYSALPEEVLHRQGAKDVVSTVRAAKWLYAELQKPDNRFLWDNAWCKILKDLSWSLSRVEAWGILVDRGAIEQYAQFLSVKIDEIRLRLSTFGITDPASGPQVAKYVYETLRMPMHRTKKGTPVTDAETLLAFSEGHPELRDLVEWRRLSKLHSTYASSFLACMRADGRVHTTFNIDGTVTLRLSSVEPNVQNLPRAKSSPEARMSRSCFIAAPGCVLIEADFNQQEPRIAANLAQDKLMLEAFASGSDFHRRTAELIAPMLWGKPLSVFPKEDQEEKRSLAKKVLLGLFYGMGIPTLAIEMGVPTYTAQRIYEAIMGQYHAFKAWIAQCRAMASQQGYCTTWWEGQPLHRRLLWELGSANRSIAGSADRSSYNSRIQGTGAAFMLASINALVQWIEYDAVPAKVVCSIHDSAVLEVREDAVQEVGWRTKQIMEGFNNGACPMKVDLKSGYSLGNMQPLILEA